MFNLSGKDKVILRSESSQGNTRALRASINKSGDLVVEGQDLGPQVTDLFGANEYEFGWTIKAGDVPLLKEAIGEPGDTLKLLKKHFKNENASKLKPLMENHEVPFKFWSRIGD